MEPQVELATKELEEFLEKLSPEQQKLAWSREKDSRPVPPDKAIGTEVAIQIEGENQPDVAFTPTKTYSGEVVEGE